MPTRVTRNQLHKWLAICIGFFIFAWIVSGIVMILPSTTPNGLAVFESAPPDFKTVEMSPSRAIRTAETDANREVRVSALAIRRLLGRHVYELLTSDEEYFLIDAKSGERIVITAEIAVEIAKEGMLPDVGDGRVERLDAHELLYPWGPLPVYRITFEKGRGTSAYVAVGTGAVYYTDGLQRLRSAVASLHSFEPLSFFFGANTSRNLLLLVSMFAAGVVITGYYVAFAPRRSGAKKNI